MLRGVELKIEENNLTESAAMPHCSAAPAAVHHQWDGPGQAY